MLIALAACRHDDDHDAPASAPVGDGRLAVEVDPRIELFSVLQRLAGFPEYTRAATPYARAADAWFAPVADDPAVAAFRQLRTERGISFDAALTLAVQLGPDLRPSQPLSPLPEGVDPRWQGVDVEALLAQVRAFRAASRFDDFRASQATYAHAVEDRLRAFVAARQLLPWFDAAFGARAGASYHAAPGLLTGAMSYGVHAGPLVIIEVMDLEAPDADGLPTFGPVTEALLAHELAHSYVNPIVHAHLAEVSGAWPMLDAAAPAMARQHYMTREIVVDESLVRAVTVLYLRDKVSAAAADASLAEQQRLGFTWTPALATALETARASHGGVWGDGEMIVTTAAVLAR